MNKRLHLLSDRQLNFGHGRCFLFNSCFSLSGFNLIFVLCVVTTDVFVSLQFFTSIIFLQILFMFNALNMVEESLGWHMGSRQAYVGSTLSIFEAVCCYGLWRLLQCRGSRKFTQACVKFLFFLPKPKQIYYIFASPIYWSH